MPSPAGGGSPADSGGGAGAERRELVEREHAVREAFQHLLAAFTGQCPVAVLSDCAVYAPAGPSPLDVLPYRDGSRRSVPGRGGRRRPAVQQIAAEALKEVYFQDSGRRAGSLEEFRFTDIEHLEFGL